MVASVVLALLLASALAGTAAGGDIMHQDDQAPKIPGCNNDFVLVKVQSWVGGNEGDEFVGVGARFGPKIVSKEKQATRELLTLADSIHAYAPPKNKLVSGGILLVERGKCKFIKKAKLAEAAGASGILIINSGTELYKMVCKMICRAALLQIIDIHRWPAAAAQALGKVPRRCWTKAWRHCELKIT
ncbi:signal peptide peptidase-like 5 [Triticum dicoccoides]|uniref:signal peptide peptidase-like 5 n=1 Tax=Triticum dicoccoides TaxID=85692 RepID=UPI000E799355|nr:signal peptide peptidase-like 5 [Triticum dicoccoides]